MRIATLQANPKIAKAVIERDAELEAFTRAFASSGERGGQIATIPVVFHVIHDYGNENISREQILDGLSILNNTFRKQAADTADIIEVFKPIHADTEIEFALISKDPEGNCHSGINRIASTLTNVGGHQVKELIHWDPQRYLNVYIVSNAAGLAGHAVWPADADTIPQWDGIVIAHNYVGSIGTSNQTQSVVFAHECGHYLNLHHIWGGNNVPGFYYLSVGQAANCNEDDYVADTPSSIGWSNCNLNASSCGNQVDNVQNAMDYSYCNIMFTEGQKTRMWAALNSPIAGRNNIWTSVNLMDTGVIPDAPLCAADYEANRTLVCAHVDNTISFSNTSYHGDTDSIFWSFPSGFPPSSTQENPTIAYSETGKHDVSLTAYSSGLSEQITRTDYVTVLQDSSWSFPFWEWFEGNGNLQGSPWFENSLDTDNKWEISDLAGHSISHSIMANNWENSTITIDELYGPPINLEGVSDMRLGFWYAFTGQGPTTNNSKLQVQISRNCETSWSTRLTINGSNLETAPSQSDPFVPNQTQWLLESINIPPSYMEDGFRFRFKYTSEGNNRIFLDDINVDVTADIHNTFSSIGEVLLFPNPASEQLTVSFYLKKPEEVSFAILDEIGKAQLLRKTDTYSAGKNQSRLDIEKLTPGVYLLQLETQRSVELKRFIKH
jgi:PKD repeat protein